MDHHTAGAYGCSDVRWAAEASALPPIYHKGQLIRVFEEGWDRTEASSAW